MGSFVGGIVVFLCNSSAENQDEMLYLITSGFNLLELSR